MSKAIITEQLLHDIADAIIAKGGATAPMTPEQMRDAILAIPSGSKFGVSMDNLIGDVDSSGTLENPSEHSPKGAAVFAGVRHVTSQGLCFTFRNRYSAGPGGITSVSFPDCETCGTYAFASMCAYVSSVTSASFPRLANADTGSFHSTFQYVGLTEIAFPAMTEINGNHAFVNCWQGCRSLTSVYFPVLETITGNTVFGNAFSTSGVESLEFPELTTLDATGTQASQATFYNCQTLTRLDFPALETITGAFVFNNCTALSEIHFGAAHETAIKASAGWSTLWGRGAGAATVSFDL